MRVLLTVILALALAGCITPTAPDEMAGDGPAAADETPCPGHWHVALMVVGDGEIPYHSPDDMDARAPVPGIHMHGDDHLIHVHPAQETCFTWADVLQAVGVTVEVDGVTVDEQRHGGRIDVDLRPWGGAWATHDVGILASGAQNAAQVLILLDPSPESRAQARQEAPGIPQNYQPA